MGEGGEVWGRDFATLGVQVVADRTAWMDTFHTFLHFTLESYTHSFPHLQAHACAATVNFAEGVDEELLAPYLDTLITKLLVLLQHGKKLVQEGALTSLASIADSSKV